MGIFTIADHFRLNYLFIIWNNSECVFFFFLQGQDYEVRTYHATNWVSTSLSGMEMDAAFNAGFRRLFNYIKGNNINSESKRTH